jgi:hypothetical protein
MSIRITLGQAIQIRNESNMNTRVVNGTFLNLLWINCLPLAGCLQVFQCLQEK